MTVRNRKALRRVSLSSMGTLLLLWILVAISSPGVRQEQPAKPSEPAPKEDEEEHGGNIVFYVQSRLQKHSVIFSHEKHLAADLKCDNCHETIFKKEFGANRFKMKDVNKGSFCGVCHQASPPAGVHGSFEPKDNCEKCHTVRVRPLPER